MKALCIFDKKKPFADGMIEMVIWQLPTATTERPHGLKYRLVYIVAGVRVVGYDNSAARAIISMMAQLSYLMCSRVWNS